MPSLDDVKRAIETALPGADVSVDDFAGGGGDHLAARVAAPQFRGLSPIERHQLVYGAVGEAFGPVGTGEIHALTITATVKD